MKKTKLRIDRILLVAIIFVVLVTAIILLIPSKKASPKMIDLKGKTVEEVKKYAEDNKLVLEIKEEYSSNEKDKVFKQNITVDSIIQEGANLVVTISKGIDYAALQVNELGNVPIMMYHGIHNIEDNKYTGGNVDKDGYQRTAKAFREDLEFYYQNGYRMIRLNDYVNGIIDVEAGKSPIILTFDDGLENNLKVTGLDSNGNIIIDPNSAVGVLEEFKKKYPDFNVTATFFINGGIFNQNEYNEKILHWLVDNGYDVGNHSYNHADFTTIDYTKSIKEIGSVYNILEKYIPNQYVNIVALPFGSPYEKKHSNMAAIMSGTYEGKEYRTIAALRVGWEAESSPFSSSFDKTFLKRIRAYDNNGVEFDIEMNFKILKNNRYISDGDKTTITVPKDKESKVINEHNLKVIGY